MVVDDSLRGIQYTYLGLCNYLIIFLLGENDDSGAGKIFGANNVFVKTLTENDRNSIT